LEQTLVILVKMPRILREIVREVISAASDLTLVDVVDVNEALDTIGARDACVVMTHFDGPPGQSLAHLLGTRLQTRVIALTADGRAGTIYELRLEQRPLATSEISPQELLAAIRRPLTDPLHHSPDGDG
jgi:hypothetical protein